MAKKRKITKRNPAEEVEPIGTSTPTTHLPGTSGKISELERRVKLRQPLWHPDDARRPLD